MRKQLVIIGVITLLVCIGFSGCNEISNTVNPEKNKFVGTWTAVVSQYPIRTRTFLSDGTFSGYYAYAQWDIKDGKLVLDGEPDLPPAIFTYTFSNNDRNLTLTSTYGGAPEIFTKQ
jgi:hypothetical protein